MSFGLITECKNSINLYALHVWRGVLPRCSLSPDISHPDKFFALPKYLLQFFYILNYSLFNLRNAFIFTICNAFNSHVLTATSILDFFYYFTFLLFHQFFQKTYFVKYDLQLHIDLDNNFPRSFKVLGRSRF